MKRTVKQNRRATSLVEVLVVLVILLIGVFAVIRVFPLGFTFLRNSESRLRSTRLAHGLIEKIQSEAANLPDAVVYSYFTGASGSITRRFVVDEDPDDLSGDSTDPYYSDVNKFRFIVGEPVKIGLPTPLATGNTSGSVYMAKLGPIYMDSLVGNPNNAPTTPLESLYYNLFLSVNSAPLNVSETSIVRDPNYYPNRNAPLFNSSFYLSRLAGPQNCLVDENEDANGGAWILFYPATTNRVFTVRFTKLVNDHDDDSFDNAVAVKDQFVVPASTEPVWVRLCDSSHLSYNASDPSTTFGADDTIQSGSEVVTREFTRLAVGASWTVDDATTPNIDESDPYQYKLISTNLDASSGRTSVANNGIIVFNPAGARYGRGQDPFKAYIDYAVLDWHIIHDDRDIPAVSAGTDGEVPVRTTLTRLKSLDYVNPDNTFYEGIFPAGDTNPNNNTDIMVVRLDTGAVLNAGLNGRPGDYGLLKAGTPAQQTLDYWVNSDPKTGSYANGVIYINSNNVPVGTPIRILYKADGEWGVALNKAMASYRKVSSAPANWVLDPVLGYLVAPDRPDVFWRSGAAAGTGQLNFAGTELNKGVTVTLQVRSSSSGSWRRGQPIQLAIDTADIQVNAAGERRVNSASVDVTKYLRHLGWDGDPVNWDVAGDTIKGATAKSRVIWKDAMERNAPWRIQDLDTYLTQATLK